MVTWGQTFLIQNLRRANESHLSFAAIDCGHSALAVSIRYSVPSLSPAGDVARLKVILPGEMFTNILRRLSDAPHRM